MLRNCICVVCAAPFSYHSLRAGRLRKMCSAECREKRNRRAHEAVPCATCNQPFYPQRISTSAKAEGRGRYCSLTCRSASTKRYQDYKAQRRASSHRRRALLRQRTVEWFDDLEIFERDRWRCGLCGEAVDKTLKSPDPMAASLDHIVSLADGGMHSRSNTQCSHWLCNSRKSFGHGIDPRRFWKR